MRDKSHSIEGRMYIIYTIHMLQDCSNGRDEAMCSIFLEEFTKMPQKRMSGHGKEEWLDVNEKNCVKLCLENKKFKCKSFSYK